MSPLKNENCFSLEYQKRLRRPRQPMPSATAPKNSNPAVDGSGIAENLIESKKNAPFAGLAGGSAVMRNSPVNPAMLLMSPE